MSDEVLTVDTVCTNCPFLGQLVVGSVRSYFKIESEAEKNNFLNELATNCPQQFIDLVDALNETQPGIINMDTVAQMVSEMYESGILIDEDDVSYCMLNEPEDES